MSESIPINASQSVAFVSDLHLDESRPAATQLFLDFLAGSAREHGRLYILGDLFEFWIGDDHMSPLAVAIADGLAECSAAGVDIFFIVGNRDFLMGHHYASRAGMRRLSDPAVIRLGDDSVVLSHGDHLCTDDIDYQQFRSMVRAPLWQRDFLQLSVEERIDFARQARAESMNHTATADEAIMDVNEQAFLAMMEHLDKQTLIHGHTHRPDQHSYPNGTERHVLGDWFDSGSILIWTPTTGLTLHAPEFDTA